MPQHALSHFAGWLAESRWTWLKNRLIHYFINRYQVDTSAALLTDIADYPTFNSFFTRRLKPELRPLVQAPNELASPVDGSISQIGHIEKNRLFQAKGFHFSLETLLGGDTHIANEFIDGEFTTIYLSPKDYHRVHMPLTGTLRKTIFIPGKLFSVNPQTAQTIPQLFARNERLVCIFDTDIGPMAIILVGAMLVGSMKTIWEMPPRSSTIQTQTYDNIRIERGAELGHFKMGSTVIALFAKDKIEWPPHLTENSTVQMGSFLGKICHS
jgi:phosphatidylserine decarboxylase